jgi:hypothetical protein
VLANCFHAVPPKRLLTFNGLHGVISQKIVLFKLIVNCKDEAGLAYSKSLFQDLSRTTAEKQNTQGSRYAAEIRSVYLTGL